MSVAAQPDLFAFLHIDLNSFFASVEQQLHPEFRGKPTGVVPTLADTTSLIAASYEAKALGIKTGTRVSEAKRICPGIILVNGNHAEYAAYSHKISEAVDRVCPVAHNPSIDEMVCQLLGRERQPPIARQISLAIKQAIRDNVGDTLRCSIGMAPNRYLAKIASDMQKPDGLIGLLPSQLPRAIAHLELRDLPGVGARTEARLNAKGIRSMPELLALTRPAMHALFDSVWGDRMFHWLRGGDTGDDGAPIAAEVQKSLGHSHVLAPEHRSPEGAWAVAHKLLHKAAMRLRMEHFHAGSLAVTLKYSLTREQAAQTAQTAPLEIPTNLSSRPDLPKNLSSRPERSGVERPAVRPATNLSSRPESSQSYREDAAERPAVPAKSPPRIRQHTSGLTQTGWAMEARFRPCQDTLSLLEALQGCWRQSPTGDLYGKPFFVGVTLRNLIPDDEMQTTLFDEPGNRTQLSATMDKLNLKYGHTTLHFAGMLPARDSAPTRIAFTQIPVQYGQDWM